MTPEEVAKIKAAMRDILCCCGHSVVNHQEGEDAPDIWPCDLCGCHCYAEAHEPEALTGGRE